MSKLGRKERISIFFLIMWANSLFQQGSKNCSGIERKILCKTQLVTLLVSTCSMRTQNPKELTSHTSKILYAIYMYNDLNENYFVLLFTFTVTNSLCNVF